MTLKLRAEVMSYSSALGGGVIIVGDIDAAPVSGQIVYMCHSNDLRDRDLQNAMSSAIAESLNKLFKERAKDDLSKGEMMPKPFEFEPPYSLKRQTGGPFFLDYNGISVASYHPMNWGSEERCIEAAWRHAYDPHWHDESDPPIEVDLADCRLANASLHNKIMREALQMIARNTCCAGCGEAALVAKAALAKVG